MFAAATLFALAVGGATPPQVTGALSGQAFLQTASGVPRTCAGQSDVEVYAIDDQATAAIVNTFGGTERGSVGVVAHSLYFGHPLATAPCDAAGNFSIPGLAPGSYYVVSQIYWNNSASGGALFHKVELKASAETKVILSGQAEEKPNGQQPGFHGLARENVPARDSRELAVEEYVKSTLIDPSSAEFRWTGRWANGVDFRFTRFSRPMHGDVTCGQVNGKNRFGGYVGFIYFVVVVNEGRVASYNVEDSSADNQIHYVRMLCQKSGY
jgi:hypothetical protein